MSNTEQWEKMTAVGMDSRSIRALVNGGVKYETLLANYKLGGLWCALETIAKETIFFGDASISRTYESFKNNVELYYIRSHECGYAGNSPYWWGKNSSGYTAYIDKAGKYTKDEAEEICRSANKCVKPENPQESMYLCNEIDLLCHRVFDSQNTGKLTKCDGWKQL